MSWTNQSSFISTGQANSGTQSLYHDGSAIASGPILDMPSFDASGDFTIEFFNYYTGSGLVSPVTVYDRTSTRYIIFWPAGTNYYVQWSTTTGITYRNFAVSPTMANRWVHMACSYELATDTMHLAVDGAVTSYASILLNNDFRTSTTLEAHFHIWPNTPSSRINTGYVDDFKVSNTAIYTAAYTVPDATTWTSASPTLVYDDMEPATGSITATSYTHICDLSWDAVSGATSYRLTQTPDGESETTILDSSSALLYNALNLSPNTSYTFNLYTNLDTETPVYTVTETTPSISSASVLSLLTRITNDITSLSDTAVSEIEVILSSILSTDDVLTTSLGDAIFIANSGSFVSSGEAQNVLTPFQTSLGPGQSINITLGSIVYTVNYDNATDKITFNGSKYSIGDDLVIGNYRINIRDI